MSLGTESILSFTDVHLNKKHTGPSPAVAHLGLLRQDREEQDSLFKGDCQGRSHVLTEKGHPSCQRQLLQEAVPIGRDKPNIAPDGAGQDVVCREWKPRERLQSCDTVSVHGPL